MPLNLCFSTVTEIYQETTLRISFDGNQMHSTWSLSQNKYTFVEL